MDLDPSPLENPPIRAAEFVLGYTRGTSGEAAGC
jgi:hypothetical protein